MSELLSFGVRAGARAFQQLLRDVHAKTEADLDAVYKVHPDPGLEDARDYPGVCRLVRASIDSNLSHGDAAHREGFLRALTDLLCMEVDGCAPDFEDWDPIKNTARSFDREADQARSE